LDRCRGLTDLSCDCDTRTGLLLGGLISGQDRLLVIHGGGSDACDFVRSVGKHSRLDCGRGVREWQRRPRPSGGLCELGLAVTDALSRRRGTGGFRHGEYRVLATVRKRKDDTITGRAVALVLSCRIHCRLGLLK
jgi:hypothetical protein